MVLTRISSEEDCVQMKFQCVSKENCYEVRMATLFTCEKGCTLKNISEKQGHLVRMDLELIIIHSFFFTVSLERF